MVRDDDDGDDADADAADADADDDDDGDDDDDDDDCTGEQLLERAFARSSEARIACVDTHGLGKR